MGVSITITDVPNEVRDELAARAARSGTSLQGFLRALLVEQASRPSVEELTSRVRARVDVAGTRLHAASIVDARDADRR